MKIKQLLALVLCFVFVKSKAQDFKFTGAYGSWGYCASYLTLRPGNLQAYFDRAPGNVKLRNNLDGFYFSTVVVNEADDGVQAFWEPTFFNRGYSVESDDGTYKFKMRINSYNIFSFGGRYKILRFGASFLDFNRIALQQKGPGIDPKGFFTQWGDFYQKRKVINWSSTFRAGFHFPMGKVMAFEAVATYQKMWFSNNYAIPLYTDNIGYYVSLLIGGEL